MSKVAIAFIFYWVGEAIIYVKDDKQSFFSNTIV